MYYSIEIKTKETYQELKDSWEALFKTISCAPYCLSFSWIDTFITCNQIKGQACVLAAYYHDILVAVLPLAVQKFTALKIARPIGTGVPSYLGLLCRPDHLDVCKQLANVIVKQCIFDVYINNDLCSEDNATYQFLHEIKKQYKLCVVNRVIGHSIHLGCPFNDYLHRTKSPRRQKELRRQEKKIHDYGHVQIHDYKGQDLTETVLNSALEIQQQSWMVARDAVFLAERFRVKLILTMARAGLARLWLMTINGQNAAFGLCFQNNSRMDYHLTAFKLQYDLKLSLGKILTQQIIRDACHERIERFDFGHSDASYKRFWGTHQHQVYRIAAGKGPAGYLVACAYWVAWKLYGIKYIKQTYQKLKKTLSKNP